MVSIEGREISFRGHTQEQDKIPGLIQQNRLKHKAVDIFLSVDASLELEGKENLEAVRSLLEKEEQVIFIGNHRSMIDGPVLERASETHGYKDISDKFVFLLGQRVKQYPGTKFFSNSFAHIDVWPHTLIPEGEDVKIAQVMTRNSYHAVRDQLEKGRVIVIFGEGTRSRNGELAPFNPAIGHFANIKGLKTHIVPFALTGTQNIWPVEKKTPVFSRNNNAQVRIGEPFEAAEFIEGEGKDRYAYLMNHTRECVDNLIPPDDKIPY